jgi:ferredoxin-NADP reductase
MMDTRDYRTQIEGFTEIQREVEVLRKYGLDYLTQKGKAGQAINMLHPKRLSLRVSEIRQETRTTKTLRLVSADVYLPPFQAGQYINLFVQVGGVSTSRPYSIASPPSQTGYYDITVRRVEDGFVSGYLLDGVRVGDRFESTSPSGNFFHNPLFHGDDLVFLAGGSGITPLMSMIREVTDRGLRRHIHLIYGCQHPDDIIFQEELEDRRRRHSNLKVTPVISDPPSGYIGLSGFINADLIRKTLGVFSSKTFYICGPEDMYAFCLPELEKLALPKRRIRIEVFGPPQDVTAQPGWPRDVRRDATFNLKVKGGRTIAARAGEPMMISLEKAGILVPASCRSGECSLCRTKLVVGKVFQPQGAKLRKSDRLFGYIHPCLAYPLEDCEIMI